LCSVSDSLVPGYAYTTAAACSLSCKLELDDGTGPGSAGSPEWEFICGGALSTAAASGVEIIGGGAANGAVRWSIGGAVATGASSKIIGDLHSVGVITFGADTTWKGNLVSPTGGAVNLGAGATTGAITTDGAITLGASAVAGNMKSTSGAITLGASSTASGITTTGAKTLGAGAQENIQPSGPSIAQSFTRNLPQSVFPPGKNQCELETFRSFLLCETPVATSLWSIRQSIPPSILVPCLFMITDF
jgi:hypothetical protein